VNRIAGGILNLSVQSGNGSGIYFDGTNSPDGTNDYGTDGILGGWATWSLNDWVVAPIKAPALAFAGYQVDNNPADWGASSNVLIGGSAGLGTATVNVGGNTTVNTIRFTNAVAVQLDIADGQTLTLQGGGILIPSGGILQDQINGGTLASAQSDLVLLNQNTSLVASLTIRSTINGSIGLTTGGSGKTVLTANNGYTGETTINGGFGGAAAGTLQVGAAGTSGSISSSSDIVDNGNLAFNRSDNITAPPISGTGNLVKLGAGVLSVTADDTLSGLVTIMAGTLQLGNGGPAGSVSNTVGIVDNANLVFDNNNTVSYSNLISGYGSLVQFGSGTLILPNIETYSGSTTVSNGTLEVNGSLAAGSAVTVSANGTMAGSGAVGGPVTDDGTIAPGPPSTIGTLTVSADPALNGTILMKLNKSVSPSNDVLVVTGMLTYGGTLDVTNIGPGTLTNGDSFKLFSAGGYSGAFTNIVPATPGAGLAWNTSLLGVNGTVSVTYAPPAFAGAVLSGTNFSFLVTNSVAGATNYVLTSTNLALPLAGWTRLATNVFDAGGNLAFTNGVDQSHPARFYLLQLP